MIYYKVKTLGADSTERQFDDAEDAIRAAMSYDHENIVLMADSQDPTESDVRFAYVWLNTISVDAMASGDFITAAQRVSNDWPYKIEAA